MLSLLALVLWSDQRLPSPKPSAATPPHDYSEERARVHLLSIVSLGVRTVGSRNNEILAVGYLNAQVRSPRQY